MDKKFFEHSVHTLFFLVVAGVLALGTACNGDNPTPILIPVERVSIKNGADDISSLTLKVDETKQLIAEIFPTDATNQDISWNTGDPSVATIDVRGLLQAVREGSTEVVLTSENGRKTAKLSLIVITDEPPVEENPTNGNPPEEAKPKDDPSTPGGETPPTEGTAIKITKINVRDVSLDYVGTSMALNAGSTRQLSLEIFPNNATDKNVVWTSDNEEVASVDANGLITAHKNGSAKIDVTAQDGGAKTTFTVTVVSRPTVITSIRIYDQIAYAEMVYINATSLKIGQKRQVSAHIKPEIVRDKKVIWKSDNEAIATITDTGVITGIGAGSTTITATAVNGGKSASISVNVSALTIVTIRTEQELRDIRNDMNGHYVLANDILLNDEWEPIGGEGNPFLGMLDGAGFTVRNLYVRQKSYETRCIALIGNNGGTIKNIGVEVGKEGIAGSISVGALAGSNGGIVTGCAIGSGSITGKKSVGGLVGANGGYVAGYATVNVNAMADGLGSTLIGGLVGMQNTVGSKSIGYATGNVSTAISADGQDRNEAITAGGLIGSLERGSAVGYATGSVNGIRDIGGLVGQNGPPYDYGEPPSTIVGYARGEVRSGSGTRIGRTIGAGSAENVYYSEKAGESAVKDGNGKEVLPSNSSGKPVSANSAMADFAGFTFGTAVGEWTFHAGRWPSINLPNDSIFDRVRDNQPINP